MAKFDLHSYDRSHENDIKGDARVQAFFALKKAWKDRRDNHGVSAKELAAVLGKDKAFVSRVLRGAVPTITLETLAVFLEALGYHLPMEPLPVEDIRKQTDFDARPAVNTTARVPTGSLAGRAVVAPEVPGTIVPIDIPRNQSSVSLWIR